MSRTTSFVIVKVGDTWKETADIISKIAGLVPDVHFRNSVKREIANLKARRFCPHKSADLVSKVCIDKN